ncbi:MAG TPA: BON domain-containing protein [Terriglobales bacterium]|nr:BON domain-containing protein [Terriglobales bacterium]
MRALIVPSAVVLLLLASVACTQRANNASYGDAVKKALQQADLGDVTVNEDEAKNTITLGGKLHSEEAKQRAADVARTAAGNRIIANEISVEPVGVESKARKIEGNVDDAIESNYKAGLISNGLDKQGIRYNAKNGVLTLKGTVKSTAQRQQAEQVASSVPNVAQVVNEIQVRR